MTEDVAPRIVAIIESEGDERAVPTLIRRVAWSVDPPAYPEVLKPIRVPRDRLVKPDQFERYVELAARLLGMGTRGGVLVLFDADDGCPAELGPKLVARAQRLRPDTSVSIVLAVREFEAWFLGSAGTLGGHRDLQPILTPPAQPEAIRDKKKWLADRMPRGRRYDEVRDQPALTALFDLAVARATCPSFDKCYREIVRLLHARRA